MFGEYFRHNSIATKGEQHLPADAHFQVSDDSHALKWRALGFFFKYFLFGDLLSKLFLFKFLKLVARASESKV